MQLVAYGAQDIYLTGNPQITFFKVVYRRHTNFSMESIKQTLNGTATPVNGQSATCTVSRNGDLVHKVYVNIDHEDTNITDYGKLIKLAELEIGGQMIDKQTSEWNNVWNELSTPESKAIGLKSMQGCVGNATSGATVVQIPLNFWFCRNPGLALPLIALQYHEVKIKLEWFTVNNATKNADVYCDYIYLDTDERRRFAQVSHEYLIEQVQLQTESKTLSAAADAENQISFSLNFNHPVKELIWTTDSNVTKMRKTKLVLNGHDRFSEQSEEYFQLRQPFDYHTAVPKQNLPVGSRNLQLGPGVLPINSVTRASAQITAAAATFGLATSGGSTTLTVDATNAAAITGANNTLPPGTKLAFVTMVQAHSNSSGIVPTGISINGDAETSDDSDSTVGVGSIFIGELAGSLPYTGSSVNFTTNGLVCVGSPGSPASTLIASGQLLTGFDAATAGTNAVTAAFSVFVLNETADLNTARTSKMSEKINVYSFALKPEEHQPSGTCNFSRIDNAQLSMAVLGNQNQTANVNIYAVNYNVLRIMSGMGGLAYSN